VTVASSPSSPSGRGIRAGGPPRQIPLGILVARVGKQLDRAFDDALARSGGTRPAWLILLAITTGAGGSQSAIASRVGISGPTLIHHLDRLQAAGLVTRTRDERNRRAQAVALTDAGREAFARLREAAVGFDRLLHTDLSDDEADELRRLLGKVSAAVSGLPEAEE
jgi:MarR family transcriptional regulator, transcriptional regulator for hemolysin